MPGLARICAAIGTRLSFCTGYTKALGTLRQGLHSVVERLDIALADAALHRAAAAAAAGPGTLHRTGSGRRLLRVSSGGGRAAGPENPSANLNPNPDDLRRASLAQPRRTSIVSRRSSVVRRASVSSVASTAAAAAAQAPRQPEFFPELMVLLKACTRVPSKVHFVHRVSEIQARQESCMAADSICPAQAEIHRPVLTAARSSSSVLACSTITSITSTILC